MHVLGLWTHRIESDVFKNDAVRIRIQSKIFILMIFLFIVLQFPECTVYSRYNKKKQIKNYLTLFGKEQQAI